MTVQTICAHAAQEIGVLASGEVLSAADADTFLGLLRRLLNAWNADRRAVYATRFDTFTLIPNGNPITIGPSGDFVVTQRPVSLDGANLVLTTTSPATQQPIKVRDAQWYLSLTVPDLTSTVPTDVYYEPDWPNGKLYFWPVSTTAYDVELMTRLVLDDTLTLTDTFTLPPGYEQAITLTLAETAQRPYGRPADPSLARDASLARAAIFDNNVPIPRLKTKDAGMTPGGGGTRADFNWLSGQITSR